MSTRTRWAGAAASVAVTAVVLWSLWPSHERRIARRLDELARTLSAGADQGPVAAIARVRRLAGFFTADVIVDLGSTYRRLQSREDIVGAAAAVQRSTRDLQVEPYDVQIAVTPQNAEASTYLTAKASGLDAGGAAVSDARELQLTWRLVDDEWLIASVRAIDALARPRQP